MPHTQQKQAQPVPGYRPCSACEEPMDLNASYSFVAGVRCICTHCYHMGFRFLPDGSLVRQRSQHEPYEQAFQRASHSRKAA